MATDYGMGDLAYTMGVSSSSGVTLKHGSTEDKTTLDMEDFLNLMVVTLKNQTMDDTADMSEMMNQMVQMSVMQAIQDITDVVNDSTSLTYAASLVGKDVTVGIQENGALQEIEGTVTGTGTLNGQQVFFLDNGETAYPLNYIMAIGKLPEKIVAAGDTSGDG